MNYLSVCSGVEAASQAWMPLGWEAVAFSEIEPFPCAVLASRFPNVPNLGDMSKIHYNRNTKELTNGTDVVVCRDGIDLLVGGTPCQSFSVAGKRAGLEGASGLAYHYARLIGEIQPRWFVWENVPGALSSVTYGDQRDFNFLLQQFSIGGDADLGVRYNCCWRVLDTQYVRVESFPRAIPQRRRRVFIVGHLATDCGGGCEVLLEQEGVRGNPAPRRVKGQGAARDTEAGAGGADGEKRVSYPINSMIIGKDAKEGDRQTTGIGNAEDPLPTLQSAHHHAVAYGINPQNGSMMVPCTKEVGQTNAVGHENGVAISFLPTNSAQSRSHGSEGDDRTVNVAIRTANTHANGQAVAFKLDSTRSNSMKSANPHSGIHETQVHCALDTTDPNPTKAQGGVVLATPICFQQNQRCEVRDLGGAAGALQSEAGMKQQNYLAVRTDVKAILDMQGGKIGANFTMGDGAVPAITRGRGSADDVHSIAIGIGRDAFNSGRNAQMAQSISTEVQPPITAKGPGGYARNDATFRSTSQFGQFKEDDVSGTLDCEHATSCGNGTPALVATGVIDKQMERNGSCLCGPIK